MFLLQACCHEKKSWRMWSEQHSNLTYLNFFLQLAWEIKSLDTKKYSHMIEPIANIGKMLGGWRKNLLSQTQTPSKTKG